MWTLCVSVVEGGSLKWEGNGMKSEVRKEEVRVGIGGEKVRRCRDRMGTRVGTWW